MNFTPRLGSAIDKAVKHLQAAAVTAVPEAAMAQAIGYSEDETPSMLRYGVSEGLLACDVLNGIRMWRLGDRPPGITVQAPVIESKPEPEATEGAVSYPGGYSPRTGSNAARALKYLSEKAPFNGEVWLVSRTIAQACDVEPTQFHIFMASALKRGAVRRREGRGDGYLEWQMGDGTPAASAQTERPHPADQPVADASAAASPPTPEALTTHEREMLHVDAAHEGATLARLASRPFMCAAFSNGRVTIQKGPGAVELTRDEALELFEHLAGFMRVPAGRGRV